MSRQLLLFLMLFSLLLPTAAEPVRPLVTFDTAMRGSMTATDAVARTERGSLLVDLGCRDPWPGITFSGNWDLRKDARLVVPVVNRGHSTLRLELLIYDHPSRNYARSLNCSIFLAPGEARDIILPLTRQAVSGTVVFTGMKQLPEGLAAVTGIDLSKVTHITLCKTRNATIDQLEIKGIGATGEYHPLDAAAMLPLIDRFGQFRQADWPGKIHREEDLKIAATTENADLTAHPAIPGFDRFGGWAAGPQLTATGRFRTEKYNGCWQLIDPDGRLFFSLGMNHVNVAGVGSYTAMPQERRKWFEALPPVNDWAANGRFYNVREIYTGDYRGRMEPGFSFLAWNMARKYGADWEKKGEELALRRLPSWGFNTLGNWSDMTIVRRNRIPYTIGVALAGSGARPLGGFPWQMGRCWDVYDPAFPALVEKSLSGLKTVAVSPWCVGVFFDNELHWNEEFGLTALRSRPTEPAKQEFVRDLRQKYGEIAALNRSWGTDYASWNTLIDSTVAPDPEHLRVDLDAFYFKTASRYFCTIRDAIHRLFPGTLYLGSRFAVVTPLAYQAATQYCDVVSFNVYRSDLAAFKTPTPADAPLLISEFHFGARDRGMWGAGLVPVTNQAERAAGFLRYVKSALTHPQFVGCHWFEYYDQPFTGRAFDGENYNHGFVSNVDTPYPELVAAARQIAAVMYRLKNAAPPVGSAP